MIEIHLIFGKLKSLLENEDLCFWIKGLFAISERRWTDMLDQTINYSWHAFLALSPLMWCLELCNNYSRCNKYKEAGWNNERGGGAKMVKESKKNWAECTIVIKKSFFSLDYVFIFRPLHTRAMSNYSHETSHWHLPGRAFQLWNGLQW